VCADKYGDENVLKIRFLAHFGKMVVEIK